MAFASFQQALRQRDAHRVCEFIVPVPQSTFSAQASVPSGPAVDRALRRESRDCERSFRDGHNGDQFAPYEQAFAAAKVQNVAVKGRKAQLRLSNVEGQSRTQLLWKLSGRWRLLVATS